MLFYVGFLVVGFFLTSDLPDFSDATRLGGVTTDLANLHGFFSYADMRLKLFGDCGNLIIFVV